MGHNKILRILNKKKKNSKKCNKNFLQRGKSLAIVKNPQMSAITDPNRIEGGIFLHVFKHV